MSHKSAKRPEQQQVTHEVLCSRRFVETLPSRFRRVLSASLRRILWLRWKLQVPSPLLHHFGSGSRDKAGGLRTYQPPCKSPLTARPHRGLHGLRESRPSPLLQPGRQLASESRPLAPVHRGSPRRSAAHGGECRKAGGVGKGSSSSCSFEMWAGKVWKAS